MLIIRSVSLTMSKQFSKSDRTGIRLLIDAKACLLIPGRPVPVQLPALASS